MSIKSVQDDVEKGVRVTQRVSISRWVNDPYPAWDRILTAHDVALRLIRRPPWMLCSVVALWRFPKRQRFRGKHIGWLKADLLEWMARNARHSLAETLDKTICCRRPKPKPAKTALKFPSERTERPQYRLLFHPGLPMITLSTTEAPPEILRLTRICEVTGFCRSMIYQMGADKRFPDRVEVRTRAVGCLEHEIHDWLLKHSAPRPLSNWEKSDKQSPSQAGLG